MPMCREEGCEQPPHKWGRCLFCHRARNAKYAASRRERVKKHREKFGRDPIYVKPITCMVDGCTKSIEKIGRCLEHYRENERIRHKVWAEANRDKTKQYLRKHYWSHLEQNRHKSAEAQRQKWAKIKSNDTRWAFEQRAILCELTARRRARLMGCSVYKITKKEIIRLYNSPCIYCGGKKQTTIDHIIPLSRGGSHSVGNIVPACISCNSSKNAKLVIELRAWNNRVASYICKEKNHAD